MIPSVDDEATPDAGTGPAELLLKAEDCAEGMLGPVALLWVSSILVRSLTCCLQCLISTIRAQH